MDFYQNKRMNENWLITDLVTPLPQTCLCENSEILADIKLLISTELFKRHCLGAWLNGYHSYAFVQKTNCSDFL